MGNQASQQQPASAGAPAGRPGSSSSSSSHVNYTSTQANGTGTQTQARKGTVVTLNVYEPAKPQASMPGFGIYHTGIEINGVEYSFAGGAEAGAGTGVMTQQPRATPADGQWKFKEAIVLGETKVPYNEFDKTLQELKDAFPANTYDLIHRNCNHFTTAVAKRLGVHGSYPGWINRAATWGAVFSTPPKGHKPLDLPPPKESVFKTSTGYRMDGSTVVPKGAKQPAKVEEKKKQDQGDKKSQTASSGKPRKNPWADPNFVPPGMRDPVVNGFAPATTGTVVAQQPAAK